MKPILTALSGAMIATSLAASSFAQPPYNQQPSRPTPRHAEATTPPPHQPPPQPPRSPNSLGPDWRLQQEEVRRGVHDHQLMPLGQVIQQLAARMPGRQLDAGLEYQGERPIYRVRWMTRDGRRVDLLIDATTGAILSGD